MEVIDPSAEVTLVSSPLIAVALVVTFELVVVSDD